MIVPAEPENVRALMLVPDDHFGRAPPSDAWRSGIVTVFRSARIRLILIRGIELPPLP